MAVLFPGLAAPPVTYFHPPPMDLTRSPPCPPPLSHQDAFASGGGGRRAEALPSPPPTHTLTCTLLPPPLSFARMRLRAEGAAGARRPCASSPRPRPPPQPRPSAAPEPHSPPPPPGGLEQRPRDCCRGVQVAGGHLPRQRRQQEEEATGGCVHPSAPPRDQPSSRARTRKGGAGGTQ